jgi:hypothetical protein
MGDQASIDVGDHECNERELVFSHGGKPIAALCSGCGGVTWVAFRCLARGAQKTATAENTTDSEPVSLSLPFDKC